MILNPWYRRANEARWRFKSLHLCRYGVVYVTSKSLNEGISEISRSPAADDGASASHGEASELVIDFRPLMAREGWIFFVLGILPILFLIFKPSLWEFFVFNIVDTLALFALGLTEKQLFLYFFPGCKKFFPLFHVKDVGALDLEASKRLFKDLVQFPRNRSLYVMLTSYLKMIPAFLVILFYWKSDRPVLLQGLILFAIVTLTYTYFYGAIFVEQHQTVSRAIAAIHKRFDWEQVFRTVEIGSARIDFHFQESVALGAIAISMAAAQAGVVFASHHEEPWLVALKVLVACASGCLLFGRVWYAARVYFFGGLRSLFSVLETFAPEKRNLVLPLHSAALLAGFEKTFNELTRRLRVYEEEFSHWLFIQAEQSRFRALGEVSALIVHDLSAPLQVVNFCAEGLRENLVENKRDQYLDQLLQNSQRSLELISSWKAYLKNHSSDNDEISLGEILEYVRTLLATHFEAGLFHSIQMSIEESVCAVVVAVPRAELIHILVNVLSNCAENLISNSVAEPKIDIRLAPRSSEEKVSILIHDNGTGLSAEKFEELTSFMFLPRPGMPARGGLGLRLIRRLLERRGGALEVLDSASGDSGTTFCIQLARKV